MNPRPPHPAARKPLLNRQWSERLLAAATLLVFLASMAVLTQGLIDPDPIRLLYPVHPLVQEGAIALGWMLAAMGWGWGLRRWLEPPGGQMGLTVQASLGVAVLLLLDWSLGAIGWLNVWGAWTLTFVGWGMFGEQVRASRTMLLDRPEVWPKLPWPAVTAVPTVALLIVAACIPPGLLWRQPTELMGYDVLEYHLQLPKEWIAAGRIIPLEHNVYSYMPNLLEAAFMHLGVWRGSMISGGISAQMLHAALTLLAAVGIARIVTHVADRRAGAAAAAIYLAVPWTTMTGSIAYNEQAMMAMGVAAVLAVVRGGSGAAAPGAPMTGLRAGFIIGLLCGAATLIKLTAAGLIALPVLLLLLIQLGRAGRRATLRRFAGFIAAFAFVLSLWLLRNYLWCGRPAFPALINLFGFPAHWTAEQAARWSAVTSPHEPVLTSLSLLFNPVHIDNLGIIENTRGLWNENFGYAIWPAALLAAVLGLRRPALRKLTIGMILMAIVTVLFWIFFTHHQSRFLVPLMLPACILIGIGIAAAPQIQRSRIQPAFTLAALIALTSTGLAYRTYLTQGGLTRFNDIPMFIDQTEVMIRYVPPGNWINILPPSRHIYAEGYATPFYIQNPLTYHTCFDTSPLGPALKRGGPDEAIAWLRTHHYTHILIDLNMLKLWTSPHNYGYDPNITIDSLHSLADHLKPVSAAGGLMLYAVPEDAIRPAPPIDPRATPQ